MFDMKLAMLSSEGPLNNISSYIQNHNVINDPLLVPHLSNIVSALQSNKKSSDIIHLSNIVKQIEPVPKTISNQIQKVREFLVNRHFQIKNKQFYMNNFKTESQKLKWAGFSLSKQQTTAVSEQLILIGQKYKVREIRFWGKINGVQLDYYILQGQLSQIRHDLSETVKGAQKNGQGINYYTFWVTNDLLNPQWYELPIINPQHIKIARKIKKYFTGYLQEPIFSYPEFKGLQKHYLKAQLVRMSYSLQLAPKGILKVHDENPKAIEYQQELKLPQFTQLLSLQNWVHKNQNILSLGRCSHFVDPSLPQDQIQAVTAQLAQKDPQIQRLRSITQDKIPQGSSFGVQNIWQIRAVGDTQIFQKDQGSFAYGIVILKNLYWPGWVSIGYVKNSYIKKNGFSNYYTGYGVKWSQRGWDQYENANLGQQAQDLTQFYQPNPTQQPKVVAVAEQELPQE